MMKSHPRILLSVGTRPEIIKMAPLYLELKQRNLAPLLLHTGQHDEMAQTLYKLWGMTPDYTIELQRKPAQPETCDLSALTALLLEKISTVLLGANPDMVMVHGDTSTALATALAAFYQKRKIIHIEAGLRSGNEHHPFPEEKNRILIGQLSHLHFPPTIGAENNLLREGIAKETVHRVGNTIVQATHLGAEMLAKNAIANPFIEALSAQITNKKMLLVTAHRRENHGEGIVNIAKAISQLLAKYEDMIVVWPVHPNPVVKHAIEAIFNNLPASSQSRLYLTEPLEYPSLLWVLKHAWMILTDSGGIQEEAVALQVPVLVLRETTERPEVIEVGAGILVGTNSEVIVNTVEKLRKNEVNYQKMRASKNPFGDNFVAARICDIVMGKGL